MKFLQYLWKHLFIWYRLCLSASGMLSAMLSILLKLSLEAMVENALHDFKDRKQCCGWMDVGEQQFIEESIKFSSLDNCEHQLEMEDWIREQSTLLGRSYAQETWKARKA